MVSAFSCMREGVQAIEERGCTVLRCGHVREMHEVGSGVVIGNGGSLGGVLGVAAVASSVAMPSVYGWSMYGWLGGKHSIYIQVAPRAGQGRRRPQATKPAINAISGGAHAHTAAAARAAGAEEGESHDCACARSASSSSSGSGGTS